MLLYVISYPEPLMPSCLPNCPSYSLALLSPCSPTQLCSQGAPASLGSSSWAEIPGPISTASHSPGQAASTLTAHFLSVTETVLEVYWILQIISLECFIISAKLEEGWTEANILKSVRREREISRTKINSNVW